MRNFSMTAYTGVAMRVGGWEYPVAVDLAGLKVSEKPRPIFINHDAEKIAGHTTAVSNDGSQLYVSGVISGTEDMAGLVVDPADNGFPWQASIGATVERAFFVPEERSVEVNGRVLQGPMYVASESVLSEVSFVPLGADDNTTATIAASFALFGYVKACHMDDIAAITPFSVEEITAGNDADETCATGANERDAMGIEKKRLHELCTANADHSDLIVAMYADDATEDQITAAIKDAGRDQELLAAKAEATEAIEALAEKSTQVAELEAKVAELEEQVEGLKNFSATGPDVGDGRGEEIEAQVVSVDDFSKLPKSERDALVRAGAIITQ